MGRATVQAVIRRPLTAEARVHARVNPCGICGGQSGTGTGFSACSSVFTCQYHSTVALQTHIIWGMRNMLTSVGIHVWVLDPPHLQGKIIRICTSLSPQLFGYVPVVVLKGGMEINGVVE
jgi:hypothetical protein